MGYLQLGICHRMSVHKDKMTKMKLTNEMLISKLNKEMDMSLFNYGENENEITFVIKEPILIQLHNFMQFQFSLYPQNKSETKEFEALLNRVTNASYKELIELSKERSIYNFQHNQISHKIQVDSWNWLQVDVSLFVIFVEGKILMEGYNSFLGYFENLVRSSSGNWSIAGAFRGFIQ
ncbi:hypothetical protein BTO30_13215 [Domibacillus antri]|uniref:Uncharacterized protein n=1 Tax=Domibacillus antri TaxID=1714264 RepID=A0A1Q8Q336_9BACI|nr:hypothetical protein [Domibacillus antri]OLN21753.1 hypothetical protein BTO30_13215 [Domibacillus antri]